MKRILGVWVLLGVMAAGAAAQDGEWERLAQAGWSAEQAGDYVKALECFQRAARIADNSGKLDVNTAATYNALAVLYGQMGRTGEAIGQYRRSLAVLSQVMGPKSLEYASVLTNLGTEFVADGQVETGENTIREAINIFLGLPELPERELAGARNSLGEMLLRAGRYDEAGHALEEAEAIFGKLPDEKLRESVVLNNLGAVRRNQKRFAEAEEILSRSIQAMEQASGDENPKLVQPLNNLALTYMADGKRALAGPQFERALKIAEAKLGKGHPDYGTLLLNYSTYIKQSGDKSRAKSLAARAHEILESAALTAGRGMTVDVSALR